MDKDYSSCSFYIKGPECGPDDRIKMSVLMANIQEAAELGALECGFDTDDINSKGACWIVLRNKIHIDRIPKWRETISIKTWHTGIEKFYYGREYEIYDENGCRVAYASSAWIIADINTHRPVVPGRTPGFERSEAQNVTKVFGETCPKLKTPDKPDFAPTIVKYGDYSELDHNNHVNNSRYIAWIYDALHKQNFNINLISDININYLSEVKDNEKVDIYVIPTSDNNLTVVGFKESNVCVFVSEITICVC